MYTVYKLVDNNNKKKRFYLFKNVLFLVPNVELPPLCSPQFKSGPPTEQAQVASLFLQDMTQW